jgi:hypothetical protein
MMHLVIYFLCLSLPINQQVEPVYHILEIRKHSSEKLRSLPRMAQLGVESQLNSIQSLHLHMLWRGGGKMSPYGIQRKKFK